MKNTYWKPGSSIILREMWQGRIWTVRPVKVVQDTDEVIALYLMPGTLTKYPIAPNGHPVPHFLPDDWILTERPFSGSRLSLSVPGASYMVYLFCDPPHDRFHGWYINLQTPLRRTPQGFDYLDQELDIVVRHDKCSWSWKDESQFQELQTRGRITSEQAQKIRSDGEYVLTMLHEDGSLFCQGWEHWTPPSHWVTPCIPHDWHVIEQTSERRSDTHTLSSKDVEYV